MKNKRYSEAQIVKVLQQVDQGMPVKEACRKAGISEPTYYAWKKKFKGMEVNDVKRLRAVEAENAKLKRIIADQSLDIAMLKEVNSRKW